MSKFYVGQKVLVTGSTFSPIPATRKMIGKTGVIDSLFGMNGTISVDCDMPGGSAYFNESDLQPITEIPETLTINGVEYTRKPEPIVEHEWKFGDVAVHDEYGVGIVIGLGGKDEEVEFRYHNGNNEDHVFPDNLTFIRRADLSV